MISWSKICAEHLGLTKKHYVDARELDHWREKGRRTNSSGGKGLEDALPASKKLGPSTTIVMPEVESQPISE